MPRRFEFVGGSSAKFWEVSVQDSDLTVCFGRIGTPGQSQTRSFPTPDAATHQAEKLIAQKTAKGYVEQIAV